METRFEREIDDVLEKLGRMGRLAAQSVERVLKALMSQDKEEAQKIIYDDSKIDSLMKDIENSCFRILLLDQPVAGDFRKVGSALKMITDLERIGDYSVDIAEEVLDFPQSPSLPRFSDLQAMGQCASTMVEKAVHSFLQEDYEEARQLEKDDDRVDAYFAKIKKELVDWIKKDEENAEGSIILMMIAKYLERIGDHAVNVGEWVDYSCTGSHLVS